MGLHSSQEIPELSLIEGLTIYTEEEESVLEKLSHDAALQVAIQKHISSAE
jgi:hypothetical protein